ncbi:Ribosomal protein S14 [Cynara cardunculus var. scolymus]|uniref:Ribosomal protein S14 n=1 Tax=Cynara cardunculus var. scolymus TaxID=59895 RepID=A0A118K4V4_CYNCS|nr:Ribosomal protein S14 [Cynara cardunculus var. scolymus]
MDEIDDVMRISFNSSNFQICSNEKGNIKYQLDRYILKSNSHGLIRKYGLMCCRQCFHNNAKEIGFIKEKGLVRTAGCNFIEHGHRIHRFLVNDQAHPESESIYANLDEVIKKIQKAGYVPNFADETTSSIASHDHIVMRIKLDRSLAMRGENKALDNFEVLKLIQTICHMDCEEYPLC